jgi:hypothetical protein
MRTLAGCEISPPAAFPRRFAALLNGLLHILRVTVIPTRQIR